MSTIQIRVTLPEKLKTLLSTYASSYGLSLASYIRQLIMEEIRKREVLPIREPSKTTISAIKRGEEEYKQRKTKTLPLKSLSEFARKL